VSISPSLADVQRAGFPIGGEAIAAIDLVDTALVAVDPPVDLLVDAARATAWWRLQAGRLPEGPVPAPAAVRRLRAAIRDVLDAHLERRAPRATSVEDINAAAAAVPTSARLVAHRAGARRETRWHTELGGSAKLAALATEVIDLMTSPERLDRLRRCANPNCSMLFLAENRRRQWCTPNICGNRARVARHYQRHRGE
jgi:predicted RNA-binding Zn ribbon-like protein